MKSLLTKSLVREVKRKCALTEFSVYQNPALSVALTENNLRPSKLTFLFIFFVFTAFAFAFLNVVSKEKGFNVVQIVVGLVFMGALSALTRAIALRKKVVGTVASSKGAKEQRQLSERQLGLMGIKPKPMQSLESESAKEPPKSKPYPSDAHVPLHPSVSSPSLAYWIGSDKPNASGNGKLGSHYTPSKSPVNSSSLYLVPSASSVKTSPGLDRILSSPWSKQRSFAGKEIVTEEMLDDLLADVDEKIAASVEKLMTPPPTVNTFGVASPVTVANSSNTASGTIRSTPLRPVRMSPSSQKFSTPPKKGENELPPAMSIEEAIKAFENLGIYPQIKQ